jgi:hypothetical protein
MGGVFGVSLRPSVVMIASMLVSGCSATSGSTFVEQIRTRAGAPDWFVI